MVILTEVKLVNYNVDSDCVIDTCRLSFVFFCELWVLKISDKF